MKRLLLFSLFLIIGFIAEGQYSIQNTKPDTLFDNILVKKISSDKQQTHFMIWVKKSVPCHYHAHHTESIVVLKGRAEMYIDSTTFKIKKGDMLTIPENHAHGVNKVLSKRPLTILSIQSPEFDGSDRIFGKP